MSRLAELRKLSKVRDALAVQDRVAEMRLAAAIQAEARAEKESVERDEALKGAEASWRERATGVIDLGSLSAWGAAVLRAQAGLRQADDEVRQAKSTTAERRADHASARARDEAAGRLLRDRARDAARKQDEAREAAAALRAALYGVRR